MSFSFIIIDKDNSLDISNINEYIKQNYIDYEILYCSPQKKSNDINIRHFKIKNIDDTEFIINSIICKANKQNIVVIRKYFNNEQIKQLTDAIESQNSIVYLKKEYKGIKKFFCNFLKKLAKLLYARDIIFASQSIIAYGENPSTVLKELENPSIAIRKFSWIGYTLIECGNGKNYQLEYKKTAIAIKTFLPLILSICLTTTYALFRLKIPMMWEAIMLLTILICFVFFILFGTNWFIKSQIGENTTRKEEIIEE